MTGFGVAVLWGSAIYHAIMGVGSMSSIAFLRRTGKLLYSIELPAALDARYEYVLKPLGAYAVFTAFLCAAAAQSADASAQKALVAALCGLFLLRAALRWIYRDLFTRAFSVPFRRSLWNIGFNTALAGSLWFFGLS